MVIDKALATEWDDTCAQLRGLTKKEKKEDTGIKAAEAAKPAKKRTGRQSSPFRVGMGGARI